MLRNQLGRKFRHLFLLILLLVKEIRDLLVVNQIQDQVLQLWFLIAHRNKEQVLTLLIPLAFQIKDPVLHLVFLQTQDLVPHLGHLLILKIQDQVPLLDHQITLQINQIIMKILIQKVQIRVLLKDNFLVKIEKLKNKKLWKQQQKQPQKLTNYQQEI